MDTLNKGTKEIIAFDVSDRLSGVSSLEPYTVEYKVETEDEATTMVDWSPVENIVDMQVQVLLDTTGVQWVETTYKLFVRVVINPEVPVLGPWLFGLS